MRHLAKIFTLLSVLVATTASAQGVKRVVVVKIDGLPGYFVDRFVKTRDPETGKSILPWFEEVFYKGGTRVPNFYTRGMSLSGPSWGQIDTGQHMQIKGNVEFDRYTLHAYDYLNFLPFQIRYGMKSKADMPAAEVMDQLQIPILADAFPYERRYTSAQLLQRGNSWEVLGSGFVNLYPGNPGDMIDEWTIGLDWRHITINQTERDIVGKLAKRPEIVYFDYYDTSFDHVSHRNNDTASRLAVLKEIDRLIGRIWVAIQQSSRSHETALILVSDHGVNSDEKAYSQGFNLVKMLASGSGGGHHVVTKRRLMLDYSIRGAYPFVPLIKTSSHESRYLAGESKDYPTALVDFDGNERSSIHLRDSDLNMLHILLKQLKSGKLKSELRAAATDALFDIVELRRDAWHNTHRELTDELNAVETKVAVGMRTAAAQPKTFDAAAIALGRDKAARRQTALIALDEAAAARFRAYLKTLDALINLRRETFRGDKIDIEKLVAPEAMGEGNSVYKLQNYVVGLAPGGLILNGNKELDIERSFSRVNYFDLLTGQKVRNNVQKGVGNRPVDFVAVRLPIEGIAKDLSETDRVATEAFWLVGERGQLLILSHRDAAGSLRHKLAPVDDLTANSDGRLAFQPRGWSAGLPLKYFEDLAFTVAPQERAKWLNEWHSESDWLAAVHKCEYSNAVLGLIEQLSRHPLFDEAEVSADEKLIRRFRVRQRRLTEADLLVLANNHWNFDVRGFNPGGNHGSFLRVSTNATFMIAGGSSTGVPRGLAVERAYDSLSFMPTVLNLMGKTDGQNRPIDGLRMLGFRKFPGKLITELTEAASATR